MDASSSSSSSKEATHHHHGIHEPTEPVLHPCFFLQALRDTILSCWGFSSSHKEEDNDDVYKSLPGSTSTSETPPSNSTPQDPSNSTENSANPLLESATPTRPDRSEGRVPKIN